MRTFFGRCSLAGVVVCMCLASSPVPAGVITIKDLDPGSACTLYVYAYGSSPFNTTQTVPASGTVVFTLAPSYQANIFRTEARYVPANIAPASVRTGVNVTTGALLDYEPFSLPNLVPVTPLVSEQAVEVDLVQLLAGGTTFTPGQQVTVTNGSIPQTPHITVPGYTGVATVTSLTTFVVPEPCVLGLLAAPLLSRRRRMIGRACAGG